MRHRVDHRKLGRTRSHRKAMLANMVMSLFEKERIKTTDAKAKEARRMADRLITRAKKGYAAYQEHQSLKDAGKEAESRQMQAVALAHWRQAGRVVRKPAVLKKLFDEIAPQYMEREGGYTRVLHLGRRLGDNARTALLELVGKETVADETPSKRKHKTKSAPTDKATKKARSKKVAEESAAGEKTAAKKSSLESASAADDASAKSAATDETPTTPAPDAAGDESAGDAKKD